MTAANMKRGLFFAAILVCGATVMILAALLGVYWLVRNASGPQDAPEAEKVLAAQIDLPFQILIPGFLPRKFDREDVLLETSGLIAGGVPVVRLVYSTHGGDNLVIQQTLAGAANEDTQTIVCRCQCQTGSQCRPGQMEITAGSLRVTFDVSSPDLITMQELQLAMNTLGPAANRQVYSDAAQIPLSELVAPAQEVEINASGVQEVTLVVTPGGYQPEHFAFVKDVPVRLIFRQVGYVSCGNELLFEWGQQKNAVLILENESDTKVLEFIPETSGEFLFHCPHYIYQGLLTVKEK